MSRLLTTAVLGMMLVAVGCAGTQKQAVSKDSVVRCPKCGTEFPVKKGLPESP